MMQDVAEADVDVQPKVLSQDPSGISAATVIDMHVCNTDAAATGRSRDRCLIITQRARHDDAHRLY